MEQYFITLDGGTTNTRAALWEDTGRLIGMCKADVGVRNTAMDGSNQQLKAAVKELMEQLLQRNAVTYAMVKSVYASGMITSNVGLLEVPHLVAPASLVQFAAGVQTAQFPEICPLPIHFIPGLKNLPDEAVSLLNIEQMDMMRGEESETLALLSFIDNKSGVLLVLPGSHTKFVTVDCCGNITGCLTSLAGEKLAVLTEYSIVADAVQRQFVNESWQKEYLLAGFASAQKTSCARAGFLTRIANQFITKNQNCCASFLLGAVLQNDISAIKTSSALAINREMQVLVAGKEPLQSAITTLLQEDGFFHHVVSFDAARCPSLAGYGALLIANAKEDLEEETKDESVGRNL